MPSAPPPPPSPCRDAFTLVELVVVLMVLAILAGIAVPRLLDVTQQAEVNALVSHIRVGEDAAERYRAEHGRYPADARHGRFPSGLEDYLPKDYFSTTPPGGGYYDWNGDGVYGGVYAGMSIYLGGGQSRPDGLWLEIDRQYDDGDLRTGSIRTYGRALQFELEPL